MNIKEYTKKRRYKSVPHKRLFGCG
ncbi:Putative uncharacterized protein [Lactococcus lactis subsp. lactis A12]|uniref:Uncharacterized protein n=1 Tax=Lactococcus lactis subsp. lactis A12 TaxID=1137134 RepID=S6EVI8_LACLL|nr:Putative uncharacterized protein [Lactococcus lactis subsp. lactis A12]SBW31493.1 Hypothetical protein LLA12_02359 [Lactococcus lactis subsp. lactis]